MRIRLLVLVLAPVVVAVIASAQGGFDVKLGEWEYTINMKATPEMLARLPPEARAVMAKPQTSRSCLTAQELKDLNLGASHDEDCKLVSKKIANGIADVVVKCDDHTQTMHYEAVSRESVRGTIKMSGGDGPSEVSLTGKWIGTACKE